QTVLVKNRNKLINYTIRTNVWSEMTEKISRRLNCVKISTSNFGTKKCVVSIDSKEVFALSDPATEPVATKKPKFSSDAKLSWYDRVTGQDLTLFCPAQGFPCGLVPLYNLLEPVGSKAPAFTGTVKGVWMENQADTDVVLFCPAQGYPVPSF
ncbi:unnamed protein product, partial [Heterotrigona itama]